MNHTLLTTLAESLSIPARILDLPSAWTGHIPFAHWLGNTLQPNKFVELGTHYGHSYFNFCEAIQTGRTTSTCFAVDTWEGDEHAGHFDKTLYEGVLDFNQTHYAEFSTLLRMTFDEALKHIEDASVDLLHIDGYHTYEAVKHDFESWRPKLQPYAVVLFHDTQVKDNDFGVWKLWKELCEEHELTFEFTHSFGLGVLQLQPQPNSPLSDFWLEARQSPEWIRDYFSHQGDRINELNEQLRVERERGASAQLRIEELSGIVDEKERALHGKKDRIQQLTSQLHQQNFLYSGLAVNFHDYILHAYRQRECSFYPYFHFLYKFERQLPRTALLLSTPCKVFGWCVSGQLLRNLKRYRDAKLILESGLFDPIWYLEVNQDVFVAGEHPLHHWLRIGWREGRLPHPDVGVTAYLQENSDVDDSKINPLAHYLRFGRAEGRPLPKPEISKATLSNDDR